MEKVQKSDDFKSFTRCREPTALYLVAAQVGSTLESEFFVFQLEKTSYQRKLGMRGYVLLDREVDQNLRRQMENRTLYVCEKHFETQFIECCKYIFYISISNAALTCKTIKLLVKCVDLFMDK